MMNLVIALEREIEMRKAKVATPKEFEQAVDGIIETLRKGQIEQ